MKILKILSGETMEKILVKKDFSQWIKKLGSYKVYAPRKDEDVWNYALIQDAENVNLDYPQTTVPSKKIIFPQREVFLEFGTRNESRPEVKETLPGEEPIVVFGSRPCEGRAFALLDKVFSGQFEDPYYWKRRNQTTLVGLACSTPPSPNCFCLTVNGSPHSKEGLDVLLTDLGDKYYVESLTKKGNALLNEAKALFQEPKPDDRKEAEKTQSEAEKKIKRHISGIKNIPEKLKVMFDSPFWDEEAMSCLRCGICTYLCPTCHCFDINDELVSTSPLKGKRVRTWDNCQFPDFTMHSSGHNPRPNKASRLRQRMMHKFQYFVELYQNFQCIGCGRCISLCPVGIDIIKVLDKVRDHG
jgi:ferredoxin